MDIRAEFIIVDVILLDTTATVIDMNRVLRLCRKMRTITKNRTKRGDTTS